MATFTMTVSEILEMHDIDTVEEALPIAHVLGLDAYPIFDEAYRDHLNQRIIARYWNREVGFETQEMFRFRMWAKMMEEMPYFNQLYESTKIKFDPISTIDITTVGNDNIVHGDKVVNHGTNVTDSDVTNVDKVIGHGTSVTDSDTVNHSEGTNVASNTANSGSRTVNSIMPQNQLSGNGDYADNASDNNTAGTNTSDTVETGDGTSATDSTVTDDSTQDRNGTQETDITVTDESTQDRNGTQDVARNSNTKGYQGLPADLLRRYRETLINVDMMILERLAPLFMSVTSSGDEPFHSTSPFGNSQFQFGIYYF